MKIEVKELQRLDIKPNEILVIAVPKTCTPKDIEYLADAIEDTCKGWGMDIKFLVVRKGEFEFSAITPNKSGSIPSPIRSRKVGIPTYPPSEAVHEGDTL